MRNNYIFRFKFKNSKWHRFHLRVRQVSSQKMKHEVVTIFPLNYPKHFISLFLLLWKLHFWDMKKDSDITNKCIVTPLPFWGFWSRDCKATITVFQSWMLLSSILLNHSSALAMNDGSLCIARQLLVGQQGLSWLSMYVTFFCVSQALHTNCEA